MGDQQGIFRQIASSKLSKILAFSLLLAVVLVLVYPLLNNGASGASWAGSFQANRKPNKIGQYIYNDGKVQKTVGVIDANAVRHKDLPPWNEYWSKILHFIPKRKNENCLRMFSTNTSKHIKVTPEWQKLRKASYVEAFARRYAPQHNKLTMLYQELARQKFVKTVCEIGFNVGQSAIAWLSSKPGIKYYGFDIGNGGLPQRMGANLKKLYPNNFELTIGDSTKTVPAWLPDGVICDIVSIDGGHTYPIVIQDIHNMRKAAAKEHIIVLDDIYYPGVNKAWKEVTESGEVGHLFDCWVPGMDIDVAIGYYQQPKKSATRKFKFS